MAFERLQAQLSSILAALLPSFLRQPSSTSKPRRIHSTAYLDGLRGVASLFVVFAHYESTHFTFLDQAWHEPPKETHASNDYVLQMPIIRTMYTGQFMITIFFIISGHVLSQKALSKSLYGFATRYYHKPNLAVSYQRSRETTKLYRLP